MDDELLEKIKDLIPESRSNSKYYTAKVLAEAAEAIEELQKPKMGTWHRVKASKRSYMFVCNSCDKIFPYLTRCCPNCGEEFERITIPKDIPVAPTRRNGLWI